MKSIDDKLEKKAFKMEIVLMLRSVSGSRRAQMIEALTKKKWTIPGSQKQTLSPYFAGSGFVLLDSLIKKSFCQRTVASNS